MMMRARPLPADRAELISPPAEPHGFEADDQVDPRPAEGIERHSPVASDDAPGGPDPAH